MNSIVLKNEPKIKNKKYINIFIFIFLFLFSGSFSTYFEKMSFTSLIILFIHVAILSTSIINIQPILISFKNIKILILILIVVILSIIWSENSNTTFYKSFQLLSTTFFAIQVALRYELNDFLKKFEFFLWVIVILSMFYIVFFPTIGIENGFHEGSWKGIFGQKNTFGIILMFLMTIRISKIMTNEGKINKLNILLIPIIFYLIIKTGSSTALIVTLIIFLLAIITIIFKVLSKILLVTITAISFSFLGVLFLLVEVLNIKGDLLKFFGRDSTLTGRTAIWETIQNIFISEKPILGYGFGLFWSSTSPYINQFQEIIKFKTITSHNGYLDLVLDIGLFGAALILILLISTIIKSFMIFYKSPYDFNVLWMILLMISIVIYNFSESMILKENSLYWFLIVLITSYVGRSKVNDNKHKREF